MPRVTRSRSFAPAAFAVKQTGLRIALALPPRVQRAVSGGPVEIDGQVLAPDVQMMLWLQRVTREPRFETLPIPRGRRAMRHQSALVGGRLPIGEVRDLTVAGLGARLYVPQSQVGEPGPHPTLLFVHGGGWTYGDLETHDAACRHLAEKSGCRVLAIDYRLAPETPFPGPLDDCVAAYRWLVEHAEDVGADRARLAVGGDSAGGNMAAGVAIMAAREGLPLAFQLLIYPGTDFTQTTESRRLFADGFLLSSRFIKVGRESYMPDEQGGFDPRASPLLADLPEGLAPAYVATAGFDPLRDEGEAYVRKLAEAGVVVEHRRFEDQIHGFFNVVAVGRSSPAAAAEIAGRLGEALGGVIARG